MMPIGTAISAARAVMIRVPTMALDRPPSSVPGGEGSWVKKSQLMAPMPLMVT